jgi:hypothetical protein
MLVALAVLVLGSGLRPACTDRGADGPMLISEMEAVLKSLDQRVGRIEQVLPTLATKSDLDRYATKEDLRNEIRGVKVLVEDARSETRLLAEHMSTLMNQMTEALRRLERIERR